MGGGNCYIFVEQSESTLTVDSTWHTATRCFFVYTV